MQQPAQERALGVALIQLRGEPGAGECASQRLLAKLTSQLDEALAEIYHGREKPDPAWVQIREYYCPGCSTQLEVEAMPRGAPPDFEFLPDLDTFYKEWLGRPLDGEQEFKDKTLETIAEWS